MSTLSMEVSNNGICSNRLFREWGYSTYWIIKSKKTINNMFSFQIIITMVLSILSSVSCEWYVSIAGTIVAYFHEFRFGERKYDGLRELDFARANECQLLIHNLVSPCCLKSYVHMYMYVNYIMYVHIYVRVHMDITKCRVCHKRANNSLINLCMYPVTKKYKN